MPNHQRLLVLTVLALTVAATPVLAGKRPPTPTVTWTPSTVEVTTGDGRSVLQDAVITFSSRKTVDSQDVVVSSDLQPFVVATPSSFPTIQAGNIYTIRLHFRIPPDANQGTWSGTVALKHRKSVLAQLPVRFTINFGDIVVPATTKPLAETSAPLLTAVADDGSSVRFSALPTELRNLQVGDVLAVGVTEKTPYGLLVTVQAIEETADYVDLRTRPATLDEAVSRGEIAVNIQPTSEMAAALAAPSPNAMSVTVPPFVYEGTYAPIPAVSAKLKVGLTPTLTLEAKWDGITPSYIKAHADLRAELSKTITIASAVAAFSESKTISDITLGGPYPVPLGPLVVPFFLHLSLGASASGYLTSAITSTTSGSATFGWDAGYDGSQWTSSSYKEDDFQVVEDPSAKIGRFKFGVGPSLSLLAYNAFGLYFGPSAYADFLISNTNGTCKSSYGVGLQLGGGITLRLGPIGNIGAAFPALLDFRKVLAEGSWPCGGSQYTCYPDLPAPNLTIAPLTSTPYGGTLHFPLNVTNKELFPNDLFVSAPELPPCGVNTTSSRTWVEIFNGNGQRFYGFCNLGDNTGLGRIWVADNAPSSIYIDIVDRGCGITYRSNTVTVPR